jgi:hypothetical protein
MYLRVQARLYEISRAFDLLGFPLLSVNLSESVGIGRGSWGRGSVSVPGIPPGLQNHGYYMLDQIKIV